MSERDKKILMMAAPAVVVLLLLLVMPLLSRKLGAASAQATALEADRDLLLGMRKAYLTYHPKGSGDVAAPAKGQGCGPGPLSFIGEAARKVGVRDRVVEMKPRDEDGGRKSISVKLDKVLLSPLTDLLFQIENSPYNFHLDSLNIKPSYDNRDLLEVNFSASCL